MDGDFFEWKCLFCLVWKSSIYMYIYVYIYIHNIYIYSICIIYIYIYATSLLRTYFVALESVNFEVLMEEAILES